MGCYRALCALRPAVPLIALCAVTLKLGTAGPQSRAKLLAVLSHINKRVKAAPALRLPLPALVELYTTSTTQPLVLNFAVVYIEMALERATSRERADAAAPLLRGIGCRGAQHQGILLRAAVWGLADLAELGGTEAQTDAIKARFDFLQSEVDTKLFLQFAKDTVLYAPPSERAASALDAARTAAQLGATAAAVAARMPSEATAAAARAAEAGVPQYNAGAGFSAAPPGLSRARVERVAGKVPLSAGETARRKLGLLHFVARAELPAMEVYPTALIASEDASGGVVTRAEEVLAKTCHGVDLDDPGLVARLLELHQGTGVGAAGAQQQGDPAAADPAFVNAASPGLKARIVGVFVRSTAAANSYPRMLAVVFDGLFGAATTPRLKQLCMELVAWSFKHGTNAQLAPISPVVLQGLLKTLDLGVGKNATGLAGDAPAVALRQFTYGALGQLCRRVPKLVASDDALAARLFRAAAEESQALVSSVADALSALSLAFRELDAKGGVTPELLLALLALVEVAAASDARAARLLAAQWAARVFPFSHAGARRICALCAGDDAMDVREEGLAGLKAPKSDDASWPTSADMLRRVRTASPRLSTEVRQGEALLMPPRQYASLLTFVRACRQREMAGQGAAMPKANAEAEEALSDRLYEQLLAHALVPAGDAALHALAASAMVAHAGAGASAEAADRAGAAWAARTDWLQGFLGHTDRGARSAMARMVGVAARGMGSQEAAALLCSLRGRFGAKRFEDADGALRAASFAAAQRRARASAAGAVIDEAEQVAIQEVANAMLELLPRQKGAAVPAIAAGAAPSPAELQGTAALGLGYIGLTGPLPLADSNAIDAAVARVALLLKAPDSPVVSCAATSLGYIAAGEPARDAVGEACVGALFGEKLNKNEGVQFSIGEALAMAFGGAEGRLPVCVETILGGEFGSLAQCPEFAQGVSADQDTDASGAQVDIMDADAGEEGAPAEASRSHCVGVQRFLLDELFAKHVYDSRANARASSTVWLLSVIRFCGAYSAGAQEALPEAQEAFGQLLGDPHELTSEMSSRGMSIVYTLGGPAIRARLVQDLVDSLSGKVKRNRRVKVGADTEVFTAGSLGETPDGKGLSTYKELCSLAAEMGKPDLVYKFMDLANHQASLKSARGAAFGAMGVAAQAGEALAPHLSKLFPKLYRMSYDPSVAVQDAMSGIIKSLVEDVRPAVDKYYPQVMAECVSSISGRLWRNREAACSAAADALSGRPHELVAPHLETLWSLALRALDDIKETVRKAATTLARALASTTLRLVDPKLGKLDECASTAAVVFPIILERGITSSAKEVSAFSVGFLIKLVEAAGEKCRPHIPDVAVCMLEAMSAMESATINYIGLHSDKYGVDNEKLDAARAAANSSSPAHDALQLCVRYLDAESLAALVPRLTTLAGSGVGLPTRVGVARLVQNLAARHPQSVKPHAKTLCKAFISGADREPSAATRRSYYAAVASLARLMSPKATGRIVDDAVHMAGRDESGAARSAQLLRELSRSASDALSPHLPVILPLAFLFKHSAEADPSRPGKMRPTPIGSAFADVWDENTASAAASLRLYLKEITTRLVAALEASSYERKREGARAVATLAAEVKAAAAADGHAERLLKALAAAVPGRVYDGKQELLDALGALAAGVSTPLGKSESGAAVVKTAAETLVTAMKRGGGMWKEKAMAALGDLAAAAAEMPDGGARASLLAVCVPSLLAGAAGEADAEAAAADTAKAEERAGVVGGIGDKAREEAAQAVAEERKAIVSRRARRAAALRSLSKALQRAGCGALGAAGATLSAMASAAAEAAGDASAWEAQVAAMQLAKTAFEVGDGDNGAPWGANELLVSALGCSDAAGSGSTSQAREAAVGALAAALGSLTLISANMSDKARERIKHAAQHDGSGQVRAAALRALDGSA